MEMKKIVFYLYIVMLLTLLTQAGNTQAAELSASDLAKIQKAAEQGDADMQYFLGTVYGKGGLGVPQDHTKAMYWYTKAAETGYAMAQCAIGLAYANGNGVPKDIFEATKWWKKAADQGLPAAQLYLGVSYMSGQGVIRDQQKACVLLRAAAEQGSKDAIGLYNETCAK